MTSGAAATTTGDPLGASLRSRLATTPTDSGTNIVIVDHNLNLQVAAGVVLEAGHSGFSASGEQAFELEGIIRASAFR